MLKTCCIHSWKTIHSRFFWYFRFFI